MLRDQKPKVNIEILNQKGDILILSWCLLHQLITERSNKPRKKIQNK